MSGFNSIFPTTIQRISIYNASRVTSELGPAFLLSFRSVHPFPERINIVNEISYTDETTLYVIICPAGFGSEKYNRGPKYYITYQLEPSMILERETYRAFLEGALYNWDYSMNNIKYLAQYPNIKIGYVSPGFNYTLTTDDIMKGSYLYSDTGKDIDVLFLGWDIYERRRKIKDALVKEGLKVWFVADLDLNGMKHAIRKSKICLNLHSQDNWPCLETIRLNILLSNQACIVSEDINDPELNIYRDCMAVVPYDKIVSTCKELIASLSKRKRLALKSYQWYSNERAWNRIVDFNSLLPKLE